MEKLVTTQTVYNLCYDLKDTAVERNYHKKVDYQAQVMYRKSQTITSCRSVEDCQNSLG